jgi:predicted nucleic acid-binding protein
MKRYIIDASVMGPLMFEDEAGDRIGILPEILERDECIVPAHWYFEVANQLLSGARRGRATTNEAKLILDAIAALPVKLDAEPAHHSWGDTYGLAAKHQLSFYDAAYLELASRLCAPLLSFDKALLRAASKDSVQVLSL